MFAAGLATMRDLVLLPGWAMPPAVFSPLLPLLEKRGWRVHLPALPLADNLSAMADAVLAGAPARAVWLGWSLGGMVAAQAACAQPARVDALVTVATNLRFIAADDWPAAMPSNEFHGFSAEVAADPATALARFNALVARGGAAARADQRRLRALCAADGQDPRHLRLTLRVLAEADLRAGASALSCASLWLYGEQDALVPAAIAGEITRRVPRATTRILPGASHIPFLSAPETVADALATFLPESG